MDYHDLVKFFMLAAVFYAVVLLLVPFFIYRIRCEAIESYKLLFEIRGHLQALTKIDGSFYDKALKAGHTEMYTQKPKTYFSKSAKLLK